MEEKDRGGVVGDPMEGGGRQSEKGPGVGVREVGDWMTITHTHTHTQRRWWGELQRGEWNCSGVTVGDCVGEGSQSDETVRYNRERE